MAKNSTTDFIGLMEEWFNKTPSLPTNAKEVLVKIAPIISIVFGVLGLIGGISGLGLLSVFLPAAVIGGVSGYAGGYLAGIFLIASSALMIAAFPGLKKNKYNGWNLLFWSEVLSVIYSLVTLAFGSAIIGGLIGFYILFQIKSYYK